MNEPLLFDQESLFAAIGSDGEEIHLRHFRPHQEARAVVLMIHGAIENGRIFYSKKGDKGFAPFLANAGFEVLVADLRGRGRSRPHVNRHSKFDQTDAICEDLTVMGKALTDIARGRPQHWVAHSWGGVLIAAHLLRFPERIPGIQSIVCFGTKRSISVQNLSKFVGVDVVWNRAAKLAAAVYGYLPAKKLGMGSDDESRASHAQSVLWVKSEKAWIDPIDHFDYGAAAETNKLPLTLHLAGARDAYLGHPVDVARFAKECRLPEDSVYLLSKTNGHLSDYGHIEMLTDPRAVDDHFPLVVSWLSGNKDAFKAESVSSQRS
ncbi:MAG: alpha/beta fold hydrolase [Chitinophagaceae bacterium]|nr:alpha/beta fold hydrolase [Oligoflexus sp.]